MSPAALEKLLRDLPRTGTLVKDRGYRQIWRFEFEGRGFYLKFYPRNFHRLKRLFRGSPATQEFTRLQALQRAEVPAPRAVAQLIGFNLRGVVGDAVILHAIEPAVALDQYITDFILRGEPIPDRRRIAAKLRDLVHQLGLAKLGHHDLHLGNILLQEGNLFLLDGYSVRSGGLTMANVMQLAHSVGGLATRCELQRGWDQFGPGGHLPRFNPVSQRQWRKSIERTHGENDYFGKLTIDGWAGHFFKHYKFPRRWAPASKLRIEAADWQRAFPLLVQQISSDQLTFLKRSRSGDVMAGEVVLGGKPISIVVKRPYKRYWYRYINEIGRGSRAWRAWNKAWNLVVRDLPTAWPLLVMQKRTHGYITDALIVFEQVPGATLASVDLDAMTPDHRDMLMRRTGGILRKIEEFGYSHFDAKANNWIVQEDEKLGPRPIMIDVDGIRHRRWAALGIRRLLRGMRDNPQYTPQDSLSLCLGYAPFSRVDAEEEQQEAQQEDVDAS